MENDYKEVSAIKITYKVMVYVKSMATVDCKALQNVKVKAPNTGTPPPVNTCKDNEKDRKKLKNKEPIRKVNSPE
ncbi:17280_t:CDS:2, partial [Funneliformis caledonium]